LLLQAKEHGMGYRVEWEDTLYCVPTPIVRLNERHQYHSIHEPALFWKGGARFYYLNGVHFPHDLWTRVVSREMPMDDILKIEDIDQRTQALRFAKHGLREFYTAQQGKMIDHYVKLDTKGRPVNYELWRLPKGKIFTEPVHFAIYDCPSARERNEHKEYSKGVPPMTTIADAMAWGMSNEEHILTGDEWKHLIPLQHES